MIAYKSDKRMSNTKYDCRELTEKMQTIVIISTKFF